MTKPLAWPLDSTCMVNVATPLTCEALWTLRPHLWMNSHLTSPSAQSRLVTSHRQCSWHPLRQTSCPPSWNSVFPQGKQHRNQWEMAVWTCHGIPGCCPRAWPLIEQGFVTLIREAVWKNGLGKNNPKTSLYSLISLGCQLWILWFLTKHKFRVKAKNSCGTSLRVLCYQTVSDLR